MSAKHKDTIVIHCLAVRSNWLADRSVAEKMQEVRIWHTRDRGWRDVGYAVLIDRDGQVAWGRDLDGDGDFIEETGAHARGLNTKGIGIALVGGFGSNENDEFGQNYTAEQELALRDMIENIKARVDLAGGKITRVIGHNEVAAKACPGFNVQRWLKNKPAKVPVAAAPEVQAPLSLSAASLAGGASMFGGLDWKVQLALIGAAVVLGVIALRAINPSILRRYGKRIPFIGG